MTGSIASRTNLLKIETSPGHREAIDHGGDRRGLNHGGVASAD